MGCASSATRRVEELDLSGTSGTAGGSTETALACGGEHGSAACSVFADPARTESMVESGGKSSVEQQIERSRVHWSELAEVDLDSITDVEADNRQVFQTLQSHPEWGFFFLPFGEGTGRSLVVGDKFAEGGQAELFHAHVTWKNAMKNESDQRKGREWVVKVFKKGTLLRHLQSQFPHGYLQYRAENSKRKRKRLGIPPPVRYRSDVSYATLLGDGRFAFLMIREEEDLRSVIDCRMNFKTNGNCGPFSTSEVEAIMWKVAAGMDWFHNCNIVHRDLKASNVLVGKNKKVTVCYISDYECSVGVVGTGFFRAPEILQACRDKSISSKLELFTKAVDVYSYGMMCYEVLTGKLPFEDYLPYDFDHVLNGHHLKVPKYVDGWIHELLSRCWQADPRARPSFEEILDLLETNSKVAKDSKEKYRKK